MFGPQPTVRIADGAGGYLVINEADFDPETHTLYVDPPAATFAEQLLEAVGDLGAAEAIDGTETLVAVQVIEEVPTLVTVTAQQIRDLAETE